MKNEKTSFIRVAALLLLAMASVLPVAAQKKIADKELVGVWVMQSMQYEGEDKVVCGKNYSQFKYYGPTGEYACAEIVKQGSGKYAILPHEYGTYTFRNGHYTEMGRKGVVIMTDKTTFRGTWANRHDVWKKVAMPETLRKEIVARCKANTEPSAGIQKLLRQYIMNK